MQIHTELKRAQIRTYFPYTRKGCFLCQARFVRMELIASGCQWLILSTTTNTASVYLIDGAHKCSKLRAWEMDGMDTTRHREFMRGSLPIRTPGENTRNLLATLRSS